MGRASHELGGGGDEGSGRDGGCSLKKPRRRKGEKGCPPPLCQFPGLQTDVDWLFSKNKSHVPVPSFFATFLLALR